MDYRTETRTCLIDDVEISDQIYSHLVILSCVTSAGDRFSTAIHPNSQGRGWRYEQYRLIQKMFAAYGLECEPSERHHYSLKVFYAGLKGLFFKLRFKVGPRKDGERQISIGKFKRCPPFEIPTGMSADEFLAMMEGEA